MGHSSLCHTPSPYISSHQQILPDLLPSFVMETLTRCWIATIWSDMSLVPPHAPPLHSNSSPSITGHVEAISSSPSIVGQHLIIIRHSLCLSLSLSNADPPTEDELGHTYFNTTIKSNFVISISKSLLIRCYHHHHCLITIYTTGESSSGGRLQHSPYFHKTDSEMWL